MKKVFILSMLFILTIMILPYLAYRAVVWNIALYFNNKRRGIMSREKTMRILKEHGDTRTYERIIVDDFMRHVLFLNMTPDDVHIRVEVTRYSSMTLAAATEDEITLYFPSMYNMPEYVIKNTIRHELKHIEQLRRRRLIHDGIYTTWKGVTKTNLEWRSGEEPATMDLLGKIIYHISYYNLPWEAEAYGFNKYFSLSKCIHIIGSTIHELNEYCIEHSYKKPTKVINTASMR